MLDQEINHLIATQVNGWIHDEGIFYHDENGNTCYLADYCNSIPHAIDLAKIYGIGLVPTETNWQAYKVATPAIQVLDAIASKAICLCLLADTTPPETTPPETV
jgi:hypothetical protein